MLPATALKSPVFMARVKAAIVHAIKTARAYPIAEAGKHAPGVRRVGFAEVLAKRTGKLSVWIAWHSNGGIEIFDSRDRDITAEVLAALRDYHAELRTMGQRVAA